MSQEWIEAYIPIYRQTAVYMEVELELDETKVYAKYTIHKNGNHNHDLELRGDMECLELEKLVIGDMNVSLEQLIIDDTSLTIPYALLKAAFAEKESIDLKITNKCFPSKNNSGEGLYVTDSKYLVFQGEMSGMPKMTYCLDGPHQTAEYSVKLRADEEKFPILIANGTQVGEGGSEGGKHWKLWEEKDNLYSPIYFGLYAGDYHVIEDYDFAYSDGKKVKIEVLIADIADAKKCRYAIESLKIGFELFERKYGKQYVMDVFRHFLVPKFNAGAMEIPGNNSFNKQVYISDGNLQLDIESKHTYAVVVHEFIHWFLGHLVGIKTLMDMTAKEGMTTFFELEFTREQYNDPATRIQALKEIFVDVFAEMKGPRANALIPIGVTSMRNLYAAFRYEGGAQVLNMLKTVLDRNFGDGAFDKVFIAYLDKFTGKHVTPLDIVYVAEEETGMNLEQFKLWYTEPGLPCLHYSSQYDENTKTLALKVIQSCEHESFKASYQARMIPIEIALIGKVSKKLVSFQENSESELIYSSKQTLTQDVKTFVFYGVNEPVAVSLRWDDALVELDDDSFSDEDVLLLAMFESEVYQRWFAFQKLFKRQFKRLYNGSEETRLSHELVHAVEMVLADNTLSYATKAELLRLPEASRMAQVIEHHDPQRVHELRESMIKQIAEELSKQLYEIYHEAEVKEPYQHVQEQIGRRAIRNLAMSWLMRTDNSTFTGLAMSQYESVDNMDERYRALQAIVRHAQSGYEVLLDEYYVQYNHDISCVSKWMSLVASFGELKDITAIVESERFDWKEPNHIKALLKTFALNNWRFHDMSGAGYQWLINAIIKIDTDIGNSDVAGKVFIYSFDNVGHLDHKRQSILKAKLDLVLSEYTLSKDLKEAVDNTMKLLS